MPINSLWLNTSSGGSLLLSVSWVEGAYDVNTNTSSITFNAQLQNPHGYTMYSGYSQIHYVPSTPPNFNDIISWTYNVPHRPDGTLGVNCFAVFDPNGASASYIPDMGRVDTGWSVASTIPRASAVTNHAFGEDWTTG